MPFKVGELIELAGIVEAGVAAFEGLPPVGQRKAVDYAKAFGADPNGLQYKIAALIDEIEAKAPPATP